MNILNEVVKRIPKKEKIDKLRQDLTEKIEILYSKNSDYNDDNYKDKNKNNKRNIESILFKIIPYKTSFMIAEDTVKKPEAKKKPPKNNGMIDQLMKSTPQANVSRIQETMKSLQLAHKTTGSRFMDTTISSPPISPVVATNNNIDMKRMAALRCFMLEEGTPYFRVRQAVASEQKQAVASEQNQANNLPSKKTTTDSKKPKMSAS